MTEKETDCSIKGTTKYIFVAPAHTSPRGWTRESGENPERYRRCMRRVPYPLMKISHWETGKAGYAGAGAMLPIREPEDLQKEKHFAIF